MHRFFVPPTSIQNNLVSFPPEVSHQVQRVLRLHPGERVMVLDDSGFEYEVELALLEAGGLVGKVLTRRVVQSEPGVLLTLCLCLAQREKFEWMLQKCTEVGAGSFLPVISQRSLVRDARNADQKRPRWQKIIQEAAEQSGRGKIPRLLPAMRLEKLLEMTRAEFDLALLPWEKEQSTSLRQALVDRQHERLVRVAILVGPEGGFEAEEAQEAQAAGWKLVTLGRRILRMETAAVVAAALVLHELES